MHPADDVVDQRRHIVQLLVGLERAGLDPREVE